MLQRGHELYFLSSGIAYSLLRGDTYISKIKSIFPECRTFEIVKSSVMAPGHSFFYGSKIVVSDDSMVPVLKSFVEMYGPFDVVHFNNIEGLTLSVISREIFKCSKLFYSAHNYFSVFSQVNLWRYERSNCLDSNKGQSCTYCLPNFFSIKQILMAHQVSFAIKRLGFSPKSSFFKFLFKNFRTIKAFLNVINRV